MNTNQTPDYSDENPDATPRQWLRAMQMQFQGIATQGETEVIASFQTAQLLLRTSDDWATRERCRCVMDAATARMHALTERATVDDKRNLRKIFFKTTNDWTFKGFPFFW